MKCQYILGPDLCDVIELYMGKNIPDTNVKAYFSVQYIIYVLVEVDQVVKDFTNKNIQITRITLEIYISADFVYLFTVDIRKSLPLLCRLMEKSFCILLRYISPIALVLILSGTYEYHFFGQHP